MSSIPNAAIPHAISDPGPRNEAASPGLAMQLIGLAVTPPLIALGLSATILSRAGKLFARRTDAGRR